MLTLQHSGPKVVAEDMPKEVTANTKSNRWMFTAYKMDGSNRDRSWASCKADIGLDMEEWIELAFATVGVTYLVAGEELCPSTGRPHLQGYLELGHGRDQNTRKKRSTMKGLGKMMTKNKKFRDL